MAEVRLTDPDGYIVTIVRDVPDADIEATRQHLLTEKAPAHAAFFDFAGYQARNYQATAH